VHSRDGKCADRPLDGRCKRLHHCQSLIVCYPEGTTAIEAGAPWDHGLENPVAKVAPHFTDDLLGRLGLSVAQEPGASVGQGNKGAVKGPGQAYRHHSVPTIGRFCRLQPALHRKQKIFLGTAEKRAKKHPGDESVT